MTQKPILTVTLNPALDISTEAPEVTPEVKLRCAAPSFDPGGGGINISRAIAIMDGQSRPLVALGGHTGLRMARMLADLGLDPITLPAPGETRQSVAVTDASNNQQYRFTMPGPAWSDSFVTRSLDAIAENAPADGFIVLSGSNPPGVPHDYAASLAKRLSGSAAHLFADTSGPALSELAGGGYNIALLRMDRHEAETLAARPLPARADTAAFARSLVKAGAAQSVIVARGSDGNIIATEDAAWHAEAAKVEIVSKVGAGDSFLAGFTLACARGMNTQDALGLAAAMASAACMTQATALCRRADVEKLFSERVITQL
ncbi:1-phosphofructokinase family hexose kinase [Paracoccus sp. SCSIO 75233]|uniref:1-phosphofructokinase family hexose kinase n=1 Tax=Paracoccus sp. SCSIO 75233 TaxID=3017782 RepID=UPI0022F074B9|nr:hexose kinase [Paracoccus sp. SCSIO 75233]WBU52372.1 hexose kinase [Paracoccus sp. SCSIO 75233]